MSFAFDIFWVFYRIQSTKMFEFLETRIPCQKNFVWTGCKVAADDMSTDLLIWSKSTNLYWAGS